VYGQRFYGAVAHGHKFAAEHTFYVASLSSVDYFTELQHVLKAAVTLGSSSKAAFEVVHQMALTFVDSVGQRLADIPGMFGTA
jgi:hypothetical protein